MKIAKMYRSNTLQMRAEEENGKRLIEGYFIVFDTRTELWRGYYEEIGKEALEGQLEKDIRALFDHDTSKVLARTKNDTLKMRIDDKGLYATIEINDNDTEAVNLHERVKRGDIDQCSFGFYVEKSEIENLDDGSILERITKLNLIEISVVTFPAYETTSVSAREKDFENAKKRSLENWKKNKKERLKNGFKNITA